MFPPAAQTHDVEQAQASEAGDQNHGEGLKAKERSEGAGWGMGGLRGGQEQANLLGERCQQGVGGTIQGGAAAWGKEEHEG